VGDWEVHLHPLLQHPHHLLLQAQALRAWWETGRTRRKRRRKSRVRERH
jgi:hypothetical protein